MEPIIKIVYYRLKLRSNNSHRTVALFFRFSRVRVGNNEIMRSPACGCPSYSATPRVDVGVEKEIHWLFFIFATSRLYASVEILIFSKEELRSCGDVRCARSLLARTRINVLIAVPKVTRQMLYGTMPNDTKELRLSGRWTYLSREPRSLRPTCAVSGSTRCRGSASYHINTGGLLSTASHRLFHCNNRDALKGVQLLCRSP